MAKRHWAGILVWHRTHLTTGLLQGSNSLIHAAKARARARGYRNKEYMITIIYLIAAKLPRPSLRATTRSSGEPNEPGATKPCPE
jgi:hypothetical protein